ncbi:dynamin family protein [Brachybacterium huguangmaarense]|uniref:Dynamin family protein n=1 Tax=Brachybacterium huguangmaarense TaxID=1652028 RepID=A0ABY6G1H2_9MICO|nr:dynamin family protein [Brachybacterium huguangmaarense]UYG17048.1 dynamin family protein [Brachybacterium huguangmaarense]
MSTPSAAGTRVLDALAVHLRQVHLPLPVEGAERGRRDVAAALAQLADHVAPRLDSLDAPLLVVVGGSTGAGKSTIVNALVGRPVTRAGAIRPTTRQPILLHHPEDAAWFAGSRILPGLARVDVGGGPVDGATAAAAPAPAAPAPAAEGDAAATSLVLAADPAVPRGLALLDAPDIDSVSAGNRELARQLLRAADLWLFVTTANRYADAVPWEVLRTAAARDVTVAVVMNRIPPRPGVAEELSADLRSLLERDGLGAARLFLIDESPVDDRGMLEAGTVAEIGTFFGALAADAAERGAIARRTLAGAVAALAGSARAVAAHVDAQEDEVARLGAEVDAAFADARERIDAVLGDGSLLRGEVLARWQDVVGTGELFRGIESAFGRVRDRLAGVLRGEPAPAVAAENALETGLVHVVIDETARAAERTDTAWRITPSGRALIDGDDLSRIPDAYRGEVAQAVRAWQGDVLELVRSEGADRRTRARVLSLGVNAVGVALMVVVFASTAFIPTGLEVGTGAATAVIGQKLLETIFGDEAVRRLARTARTALATRLDQLVAERAEPFRARLDVLEDAVTSDELLGDARALEQLAAAVRGDRAETPGAGRAADAHGSGPDPGADRAEA